MALHRNRWVQLVAGFALGLQLLIASGLAMSAPSAHSGAAHTHAMSADSCHGCGTHAHRTTAHSIAMCKVACAVASVPALLPLRVFALLAARDAAPTSVVSLQDRSSPADLLRPPAGAAVRAA